MQAPQAPAAHAQCFQGQQTAQHGAHASRGSPPAAAAADAGAAAASVGVVLAQYGRMSDDVHLMEAPLSARPLHALSPVRSWAAVLAAVGLPCAHHQTYTQAAMQKALKDPNMAAASSARGHEELGYLLIEGENTIPCCLSRPTCALQSCTPRCTHQHRSCLTLSRMFQQQICI